MKEQVGALLKALGESGCEGARARMSDLVDAIQAPIDGALTRAVLDALRSRRCFLAMQVFATEAAKAADGNLLVYVKRQLAQAKIELGRLDEAVTLLEALVPDVEHGVQSRSGARSPACWPGAQAALRRGGRGRREGRRRAESRGPGLQPCLRPGPGVARRQHRGAGGEGGAGRHPGRHRQREGLAQRLLDALQEKARPSWDP